jgi:hypothetical protein
MSITLPVLWTSSGLPMLRTSIGLACAAADVAADLREGFHPSSSEVAEPHDESGFAWSSTEGVDVGVGVVGCRPEVLMLLGAGLHHSAADARRVGCLGGLSTRARFRRAVLPGETGGTAGSAEGAEEGPLGRLEVVVVVDPSFRAASALRRWLLRCLAFRVLLSFLPLEGGGA